MLQATKPPPQRFPVPLSKSLSVVPFAVHKVINALVQSLEKTEEMSLIYVQLGYSVYEMKYIKSHPLHTIHVAINSRLSCYYCGNEPVKMTQKYF